MKVITNNVTLVTIKVKNVDIFVYSKIKFETSLEPNWYVIGRSENSLASFIGFDQWSNDSQIILNLIKHDNNISINSFFRYNELCCDIGCQYIPSI